MELKCEKSDIIIEECTRGLHKNTKNWNGLTVKIKTMLKKVEIVAKKPNDFWGPVTNTDTPAFPEQA